MLSEIGSNYWLIPNQRYTDNPIGSPKQFNCEGNDYVWLSTGRSAIKFVIKTIEKLKPNIKKTAVLPSFTCDTVFEPFINAGYQVYYYTIDKDLRTTSDAIMETALNTGASIVLFHRYFGFDTLDRHADRMCGILRDLGKFTIEDCTQTLYSDIHRAQSDFTIGSIRKWTGTPDGGFAVCREGSFDSKPATPDVVLERAKVEASFAKYRFLFEHQGDKNEMLAMYRIAEEILNNQSSIYSISDMSVKVQANIDREELVRKRRENFQFLSEKLTTQLKQVFHLGKTMEVPLYFPVLVDDRPALQKYLVYNSIYAPIVWPKDDNQPLQCEGAEYAYEHLLCIPIDQRYNTDDMNRIVEVINRFFGK